MSDLQAEVEILDVLIIFFNKIPGNKKAALLGSPVSFWLDLSPSFVISHRPDCPNTIMSPAN
jgi:hypothetical protein